MAKGGKHALTQEELLEQALVREREQPYSVPENWVWCRGSACLIPMTTQRPAGDTFYYIDIDSIDNLTQKVSVPKELDVLQAPSRASRELKEGDTLFSMVRPYLKNIAYIDDGLSNCIASTGFCVCRPSEAINSKYLYFLLTSGYMVDGLNAYMKGDNSPSIRQDNIYSFPFPLPPLAEQQRIVERVESLIEKLDRAKELMRNALDSFETRKAAILHKAFTGELTARWREENGVGMESWASINLEELIEAGPQNGLYKPRSSYGAGTRIIRIDSFYDGYIEPWQSIKRLNIESTELDLYALKPNDILINRVNSIQFLGKSALVRELPEACVFESNIMRLSLNKQTIPEYAILYLNSTQGLSELRKNAKHAVNQASINQQDVKNVLIPCPSIPEQHEIVRILDDLFEKEQRARELCDVIDKIDLMKKVILARAFRGELGTNDPSEESAVGLLRNVIAREHFNWK